LTEEKRREEKRREEKKRGSGMEAERKRWHRDTEPVTFGDTEVEPGKKQKSKSTLSHDAMSWK